MAEGAVTPYNRSDLDACPFFVDSAGDRARRVAGDGRSAGRSGRALGADAADLRADAAHRTDRLDAAPGRRDRLRQGRRREDDSQAVAARPGPDGGVRLRLGERLAD